MEYCTVVNLEDGHDREGRFPTKAIHNKHGLNPYEGRYLWSSVRQAPPNSHEDKRGKKEAYSDLQHSIFIVILKVWNDYVTSCCSPGFFLFVLFLCFYCYNTHKRKENATGYKTVHFILTQIASVETEERGQREKPCPASLKETRLAAI